MPKEINTRHRIKILSASKLTFYHIIASDILMKVPLFWNQNKILYYYNTRDSMDFLLVSQHLPEFLSVKQEKQTVFLIHRIFELNIVFVEIS